MLNIITMSQTINSINMNNKNGNLFIGIDGNIGSGKSTLLENISNKYKDDPNVIILKEPLDIWDRVKDENGNMLTHFYADTKAHSFAFQILALLSRYSILKKIMTENKNKIIISERTLLTDKYVFANMLHKQGNILNLHFQVYLQCFEEFSKDYPVDHIIYVKTDPEICHSRIQKRGRIGEETIPLDYLIDCHQHHEGYLNDDDILNCPKLVLDGNSNIFEDQSVLNEWIQKIDAIIL